MKCLFCSYEFDEQSSQRACGGCSKFGGCRMIKCPRCGYETPPDPEWIKRFKHWLRKDKGQ